MRAMFGLVESMGMVIRVLSFPAVISSAKALRWLSSRSGV